MGKGRNRYRKTTINFLSIHTNWYTKFYSFLVPIQTYKLVWTEYELVHYILQFFSTNSDLRIGMDGILDIEKNTCLKKKNGDFHVEIGKNRYPKTYTFIGWT